MNEYECIVGQHNTDAVKAATIGESSCCLPCAVANNHPGKFQAYSSSDPHDFINFCSESMGKALILYEWSMESGAEDESMGPDGWGRITRFDNFLLNEESSGFVTFDEYKTSEEAEKVFQTLYMEGWGQTEYDIFVSHDYRRGWQAYDGDSGKVIQVWPREGSEEVGRQRVLAAVSLHMRKTGYFPDIWEVGERGDVTNIGHEVW